MQQRIQKILATMGITSRRKAEEMIIAGRVSVNGKTAVIGMKADPETDHIKLDGKLLTVQEPRVYLIFNKPKGVITSLSDPEGRPVIMDFLRDVKFRVFPVGRLDYDTEGLILLTNDGELANSIMHPSKKIPKVYLAKIEGFMGDNEMTRFTRGIMLEDGMTAPARIRRVRNLDNNSWIEITIYEGRKRQVRRMLEAVGHPALKLKRTAINGISLGKLKTGDFRYLSKEEIKHLKSLKSL
jgi:23S rRNA pseudouridine2605 synthase